MADILGKAVNVKNSLRDLAFAGIQRRRLNTYLSSDRRPWSTGYWEFREQSLREAIEDVSLRETMRADGALPERFGYRLDARIIEIPWTLSRVRNAPGRFLDAGSALNYEFVLSSTALRDQKVTIVTLAPEGQAFWSLGVSYVFGDLRQLDFRDGLFDMVACISTIEHIGMDNSMYAGDSDLGRRGNPTEFLLAVGELKRVLKPGGKLCITFPFGRYENHGWFQQFDAALVDELIESFQPARAHEAIFRYRPEGWYLSDRQECAACEFFDVHESRQFKSDSLIDAPADYAAGERGVACLELHK
jgi:SAM-dependent methyltransferase